MNDTPKYSVLILARNEAENLKVLLPLVVEVLEHQAVSFEIVIVDGASSDDTVAVASQFGARVIGQNGDGYGAAFKEGVASCRGEWIITLDADHSHPPHYLRTMIENSDGTDLVIASRYISGGTAIMETYRFVLSRTVSMAFGFLLNVNVCDLSSGFRMYRGDVIRKMTLAGRDFDILIEALIRLVSDGFRVREIPFIYEPRVFGRSNARLFKFMISYFRTLRRMWQLRNSTDAADYDERAFNSRIPLQRWWQRRRLKLVLSLLDKNAPTVDVGCGSSRITRMLSRAIGVDTAPGPLRYLRARGVITVQGSLTSIPLENGCCDQVVLNQVIQQVAPEHMNLNEIRRILKPGGILVIGTPDPTCRVWRYLELVYSWLLPESLGSRRVARYSRNEVLELLTSSRFRLEKELSILRSDRYYKAVREG